MTFDDAYARYHARLLGYVRRRTAEAEDVAQEVWLRAYKHWDRCRTDTVQAWIYTIARRVLIDRAKRRPMAPLPTCESAEPGPEMVAAARDAWAQVERLPERDRRIVESTYLDGRSYRQTAERLGISKGTVCLRLQKILNDWRGQS